MSDRLSGLVLRHLPASLLSQRDRGVVCNLVRRRAPLSQASSRRFRCTSALVPLVITAGGSSAVAATPSCSATVPCAPTNVSFPQEGSWIGTATVTSTQFPPLLGDIPVCGIEGDDAPLTSAQVDASDRRPDQAQRYGFAIVIGSNGYQASAGTTEGNYPDTESFGFTPATQLKAGRPDTDRPRTRPSHTRTRAPPCPPPRLARVLLPSGPGRSYGSWAISPGCKHLTNRILPRHGPAPELVCNSDQDHPAQCLNPYDPPAVKNGPALNNDLEANPTSSGTSAQVYGLDYATDTALNTNTNKTNSQGFANFVVEDSANEDVVVTATGYHRCHAPKQRRTRHPPDGQLEFQRQRWRSGV